MKSILKERVRNIGSWILTVAMLVSMLSVFGANGGIKVNANAMERLNRSEAILFLGENLYSTNKTYLEVVSGNPVLSWFTEDESVAIVSPNGVVYAIGEGVTTITAQTNLGSASCTIEVVVSPDAIQFPEKPLATKPASNGYPLNDSVHDPEIIYVAEENMYYMLCTHNRTIRKSSDLITWTNTVTLTPGFSKTADDFVKMYGKYTGVGFWAPDIVYNHVTGKYYVYYSVSNTLNDGGRGFGNKCSAIGLTVLEPKEGELYSLGTLNNWKDAGIVVKSYDAWRDGGYIQSGRGTYKFGMDNVESAAFGPNAIDPMVTFDKSGERMFMVYGSFFEGIFVLELNPETGLPFDQETLSVDDPFYAVRYNTGIRVANRGGSYAFAEPLDGRRTTQSGIEGPTMFYSEETGYYYLMVSYDYLDSTYNVRIGRSRNIEGPYYDYNGYNLVTYSEENLILGLNPNTIFTNDDIENPGSGFVENSLLGENDGMLKVETLSYDPNVGTKILAPYQFAGGQRWVATGHNSVFKSADGKWLIGSHAKNPQRLHVRSLLWTEDGWPMASPARYAGENTKQVIDASKVAGDFELAIFNRIMPSTGFFPYVAVGVPVQLKGDRTVTSSNTNYTGFWRMYEDNKIDITINNITYTGTVSVGWDWENWDNAEFVFAALSDDGTMLWGKGGVPGSYIEITPEMLSPTEQINNIIDVVDKTSLNKGNKNSMIVKLNQALKLLNNDKKDETIQVLEGLTEQIDGLTESKEIEESLKLIKKIQETIFNIKYFY